MRSSSATATTSRPSSLVRVRALLYVGGGRARRARAEASQPAQTLAESANPEIHFGGGGVWWMDLKVLRPQMDDVGGEREMAEAVEEEEEEEGGGRRFFFFFDFFV